MVDTKKSLGIYIHIPFCKQKCSYCNFAAYENIEAYEEAYVDSVLAELQLHTSSYPQLTSRLVDTIYLGGGTPTHISLASIERIVTALHKTFTVAKDCEISIESNPGERDLSYFSSLVNMGFNRVSFGIQTLDDNLLQFLRRTHTAKDVFKTLETANRAGFTHINGDLIYALPGQTIHALQDSLRILNIEVLDHVSIYGLQLENGSYLEKLYKMNTLVLPSEEEGEAMYDCMIDACIAHGYERYEISNFAKNQAYSHHNLKYWNYDDYIGIGCGAHGFYENYRYGNTPYIVPYINTLKKRTLPILEDTTIDTMRGIEDFCFLALRTQWGISPQLYEQRFQRSFENDYKDVVVKLVAEGFLEKTPANTYCLSRKGAKYGNYVFGEFLK